MVRGVEVVDVSDRSLPVEISRLLVALARSSAGEMPVADSAACTGSSFIALVSAAEHHRLLGVLHQAVVAASWPLEPAMREHLQQRLVTWQTNSLHAERLAVRAVAVLERAEVPVRVLKGVALAHLVFDDPSSRVFADLDLLVRAADLERAVKALASELDAVTPNPEPRPGFTREFGKEWMMRVGRVELDLHRTLAAGPFGLTIDVDDLFDDHTDVHLGGATLPGLGPAGLVLHACYNAALGDYPVRLSALRDLVRIVETVEWSSSEVLAMVGRWRGIAVVQRAAELATDLLELDRRHPLRQLTSLSVPRREALLLRSYLTPARGYTRQVTALAAIPGVRARARYVRAIALPSREYLKSRGWSEGQHVRRALRRLTRPNRV